MDEILLRRLIGLMTLAVAAFLLSWLLPRPGLQRLEGERLVTMDLTRPDSAPREQPLGEAGYQAPQATPDVPTDELLSNEPAVSAAGEGAAQDDTRPPADEPAQDTPTAAASATVQPEPPVVAVEPKPAPPPAPKPSPPPKPEPAPSPKPPVVSKPAPAAVAKPAAVTGAGVTVQAGAYSFLDKAQGVVAKARSSGVSCIVSPADTAKGTLYRVRCGPYDTRDSAEAAIKLLAKASIAAQVVSSARR